MRSEKFANVHDIMDGLKNIDKCNDLPLFVTDRMGVVRQLKIGTKVFSSLSVAEKVAEFDHDLKILQDTIASAALDRVRRHGQLFSHLESCRPKYTILTHITVCIKYK